MTLKSSPIGNSNIIVYKTSPPTSWGGQCDFLVYFAYQFLTWEPEEDWLVSLWTFFLSLCSVCWDRKKKKKEWLFLIGAVVNFLFVDYCWFPGFLSLSCYCSAGCTRGNMYEFVGELCGGFPCAQSPEPDPFHVSLATRGPSPGEQSFSLGCW